MLNIKGGSANREGLHRALRVAVQLPDELSVGFRCSLPIPHERFDSGGGDGVNAAILRTLQMWVEVFHDSFQLCKGRIAHVVHPVYQLMLLGGRHWNGDTQNIPEEFLIRQTGNLKQSFNLTFGPHNALSTQAVRVESVSDSKEVKNSIAVIL